MNDIFAARLRELRCEANLSQKQLAAILHISAATYSNYENGIYPPPFAKLCTLAKELHCSLDYLCGLTTINVPYAKLERPINIHWTLYTFLQILFSLNNAELSELLHYTEYLIYKRTENQYLQPPKLHFAADQKD